MGHSWGARHSSKWWRRFDCNWRQFTKDLRTWAPNQTNKQNIFSQFCLENKKKIEEKFEWCYLRRMAGSTQFSSSIHFLNWLQLQSRHYHHLLTTGPQRPRSLKPRWKKQNMFTQFCLKNKKIWRRIWMVLFNRHSVVGSTGDGCCGPVVSKWWRCLDCNWRQLTKGEIYERKMYRAGELCTSNYKDIK